MSRLRYPADDPQTDVKKETNKDGSGKGQWSAWKVLRSMCYFGESSDTVARLQSSPKNTKRKGVNMRTKLDPKTSLLRDRRKQNPPRRRIAR